MMALMVMEVAKDEDQVLQFGKEEREKQKWAQGKGILDRAIFVSPIKTP
jgi:hypothetical protein